MMDTNACCFAGHRQLPVKHIQRILINLDREIEKCRTVRYAHERGVRVINIAE